MKNFRKEILAALLIIFISTSVTSQEKTSSAKESDNKIEKQDKKRKKKKKKKKYKLPNIDLSNWKVTIPIANEKGKPFEVSPPEILDYGNNENLHRYMYNDSSKGTLVFYTEPTSSTTKNTKYSRSELREQMESGSNSTNWTFEQGGTMKGKLAVKRISRASDGKHHRTIIMQIHGRLTNEQRELIGKDDNDAPPILKIYWDKGKIRVKTKILKNINTPDNAVLFKDAWGDDEGFNFEQEVGFSKFTLEVRVSKGKLVVVLNNNEFKVYENIHMDKWGVFENYFKAGNYLQTRDEGAFAEVHYYELEVTH